MSTSTILNGLGVAGGISGLAALLKVFVDRTKVRTDAVDQIADTSVQLLAPMREEINRLRTSLRSAEQELDDLRRQMRTIADRHDEVEQMKGRVTAAERTTETLRAQIKGMYAELSEKDNAIAERDRLIADLRAGRQVS